MLPLLRVLALVPLVVVSRLRRIERRTVDRLKDGGANTVERAILLEDGGAISRFVYGRLSNAGVLLPAANDRYYFNEAAYDEFRGRRRRRGLIILTVVLVIIAVMYFRGEFP